MADLLKMLVTTVGNRTPAAATDTTVYTVTAPATNAMLSRIVVCNTSAVPTTFRIAVVESGGSLSLDHYLAYDAPIGGNETINFAIGGGLILGDSIHVYNTLATLTFTPFGMEVS
jgi:hypothetical protein